MSVLKSNVLVARSADDRLFLSQQAPEDLNSIYLEKDQHKFPCVYEVLDDVYKDIRCDILHQAETTNAWRIVRKGKLINIGDRSINADLFLEALEKSLENYIGDLKMQPFEDLCGNMRYLN